MNWFYAVLFDYPLLPVFSVWTISGCLWWYTDGRYWGGHRFILAIGICIAFFLVTALSFSNLDEEVIRNPIQTHYYIHEYQGKDERVAFCFKRFETQQNMGYSEFMQKCFADDWERHRYENLPK